MSFLSLDSKLLVMPNNDTLLNRSAFFVDDFFSERASDEDLVGYQEIVADVKTKLWKTIKKEWEQFIEGNCDKDFLDIPSLMKNVEQECLPRKQAREYFQLFTQKIKPLFALIQLPDESIKDPILHLDVLQDRYSALTDRALETIWNKRLKGLAGLDKVPPLRSVTEIRCWLNSPDNLELIQSINELDLSSLGLKVLPREVELFGGLTRLNLSNNQLNIVPSLITDLTSLEFLALNNNNIEPFPSSIGNLELITELDLNQDEHALIQELCMPNFSKEPQLGIYVKASAADDFLDFNL